MELNDPRPPLLARPPESVASIADGRWATGRLLGMGWDSGWFPEPTSEPEEGRSNRGFCLFVLLRYN